MRPAFTLLPLAVALSSSIAAADNTYLFTINAQQSQLNSNVNVTAPSTGSLIGDYDPATNPTGTRTKPGFFGTFGETENVEVPLTVTVVVGGNNSTNPTGSFALRLDTQAGQAGLSALALDLLGGEDIVINASANMLWQTFRTRNPTCLVPGGITIPFPLGQGSITTLTAQQGAGEALGTLVQTEPGVYTVAIPVTLTIELAASFLGTDVPPTPQEIPLVFAATVTVSGSTASIAVQLEGFDAQQTQDGPIGDPFSVPFTEPLCGGSLIFNLQLQSLSVASSVSGQLLATGDKQPAPTCPCDWNNDGQVSVPDIFAFLNSWFAGSGDFDGVNGTQVADIFAFLACWFAPPAGC